MDRTIDIQRYVGGEEYMVHDRTIRVSEATPEQIRQQLRLHNDAAIRLDAWLVTQPTRRHPKGSPGAVLAERRRMERWSARTVRHLWLHLKRKER